ncbi:XRE family transcriptional regulator [Alteromonas sp. KUL156]|nr:XRE family transcriptional regulator [Alteromonas sp. KUL154]GFD98480.1 XRE family transcriptional regulator [Alteromonas sp. KUL156]
MCQAFEEGIEAVLKSSKSVEQRRHQIVAWVKEHGQSQVEDLATRFATSEVTIRKDLAALSQQGLLIRQFGGAVPVPSSTGSNVGPSQFITKDALTNLSVSPAVNAIGQRAASLVKAGSKLVIDCGSTTASVLPYLSHIDDLVVMTNTLATANYLTQSDKEPTVLMVGGTWDAQSQSFQGAMAEQLVNAYSFDIAFIGAAGIDVNRGTTTFNELIGVTRAMAKAADKVVVLASSKKLTHKMPNLELSWTNISVLITDEGISDEDKLNIENQGVTVLIATPSGE